MTVNEIRQAVEPHKPMSKPTLYKHLNALGIKPIAKVRQIPQLYPDNAADRILRHLGITTTKRGKVVAR